FIAWFQAKHIGRHNARWNALSIWRWRCNTNIEFHQAFFFWIVSHRIGTLHGLSNLGLQFEKPKPFPVTAELRFNVKVRKLHMMWRALQLNIAARTKIHVFAFG